MARYQLMGGTCAFVGGKLVRLGEVFEYDGEKPPKYAVKLDDGQAPVVEAPPPPDVTTMHTMQIGDREVARPSDQEPIPA